MNWFWRKKSKAFIDDDEYEELMTDWNLNMKYGRQRIRHHIRAHGTVPAESSLNIWEMAVLGDKRTPLWMYLGD